MLKKISVTACIFTISVMASPIFANDLDDGIGIDEPIDDKLQLNVNVDYIRRSAKSKAQRSLKDGKGNTGCGGAGNQSFGPGANLKGATIINLSNNKGANAICIKK